MPGLLTPRITIGAPRGRSGKTSVSIGLARAFQEEGKKIIPFKKGPDFIDPAWLTLAAGKQCHNLDLFLLSREQVRGIFAAEAVNADLALIEGNMGLFDGLDLAGSGSTAELAKLLQSPVILVLDVTRMTRTAAAVVQGLSAFDPKLAVAGVILNRVGSSRQALLVRTAIEEYCGVPVVGTLPKLQDKVLSERHLGLVPPAECPESNAVVETLAKVVKDNVDLGAIGRLAQSALPLAVSPLSPTAARSVRAKIGVFRDAAFQFYYPENLQALRDQGGELVEINALNDRHLPPVDGLYLGGGFPENWASVLADNSSLMRDVALRASEGLPIYAECGGLIYLGRSLICQGREYPMAGVFPLTFTMEAKPAGHGYMTMEVAGDNPYYPRGTVLKGHEFHYSRPLIEDMEGLRPVFKVTRGTGFAAGWDGLIYKHTLAHYAHFHAVSTPQWAQSLVELAAEHQAARPAHTDLPSLIDLTTV